MNSDSNTYFVIVRLAAENTSLDRLRECAPKVKRTIESLSRNECQLTFTSPDGSTFGYFLRTTAEAGLIRAELFGSTTKDKGGSPLLSDDSAIIFKVGDDYTGIGFSKAWTWLQHHHKE